ncbi:hypothetical protein HYH03_004048 [Edaphochlamys debaryana]|uniref:non-specific serine/threonine protein kinase n=1 Tax=Edaphochlamys debaryana TaxID=47281 RepID=A0A835Y835_9CHLO|nr:hypothetical protein HYH03_004048 [Edaphochlamys debaryana]|eukprot:KAG2497776.1 hypothetical protein HYH03_004048 [Edaphochlamys debaryana]
MQNYQVVKKLGTGTYGSAYLVSLRANPVVQYVLKKVKVEAGSDLSADSEVKVLRSLAHPLVLSYVDHFMYKGHLCIVTEYCDGGDLYQLLRARKTPLPEAQLLDLFAQVLLAIQHVHSKNILHRDMKTQNIFLTSAGSIRLGDFGISRPLNGTMDLASTIIGTPYYMSPEVMSSMPYDFKSDMWSLGCVLYEMMSLKHAFDAADMSSLVMKILRGEHLPIPQGFSQELKDLVRQLLCKNPKMRPSAEQIMKMPFMKDYVSRARELVASLDRGTPRPAGRRTDAGMATPSSAAPVGVHHRHSYSVGMEAIPAGAAAGSAGAPGLSPVQLDRELQAAKERLRRIQLEREALLKQAQQGGPGANGGSVSPGHRRYSGPQPVLTGQHSEPNLAGAGARAAAGGPSPAPAGPPPGSGASNRGKSWRDKEDALARLQARTSQRDIGQKQQQQQQQQQHLQRLSGDAESALERHREARQLRNSRPQSPEYPGMNGGANGSPPLSAAALAALDPRTRMKVRKEEEARRREAELLNARKAYFEERKQAAARQQQLYMPSANNPTTSTRRATDSSPHSGDHYPSYGASPHGHHHHPGSHGASLGHGGYEAAMAREGSAGLDGGPSGYYYAQGAAGLAARAGMSGISDSDDDLEEEGAAQEFEAELVATVSGGQSPGGGGGAGGGAGAPQLQQALDRGGLADRIQALREVCAYNLGAPLYELIYGYIRKRMAQGLAADAGFRAELMQRLGPGRMQYVHLIDQLIYFEDRQTLQAAMSAA